MINIKEEGLEEFCKESSITLMALRCFKKSYLDTVNRGKGKGHGILTEGEGSVQLTSSVRYLVL